MAIYTLDQFLGSFTVLPLGWSAQGALQLPQQTQPRVPTGTSWAQGHWPHLAANQLNIHTWPLFLGLSGAGEGSTVGVFIIFILVSGFSVYKYTFFCLPHLAALPAGSGLFLYVLFPNSWVFGHKKTKGQLDMPKDKQRISQTVW